MLRTEEEAKKCWCPLARAAVSDDHQSANFGDNLMRGRSSMACIASECMAWQWSGYRDKDGVWWVPDPRWPGSHNALGAGEARSGFCGLAGKSS